MASDPQVSILIPAKNEAQNLDFLLDELGPALAGRSFEILIIDDGSTDDTSDLVRRKKGTGLPVRLIRHARSLGKSAALRTGAIRARGSVLVTVDGDGQNDPVYVSRMLDMLDKAGPATALIAGQRENRTDGDRKKFASRLANGLRRRMLADGTRDTACGLKAVRRDVFVTLPFFDGMHRFLPALILREGHGVAFLDIVDRPRKYGQSHYGIMDRGVRGLFDLFGVWWLRKRFRGRAEATELS